MADTYISVQSADPFVNTASASIWSVHDRFFKTGGLDRDGLVELSESEFSLYSANEAWQIADKELKDFVPTHAKDAISSSPDGYEKYKYINDFAAIKALHKAEWLVSAVMDACYVLTERVTSATKRLNKSSHNQIWRDIDQKTRFTKGNESTVEQNLVRLFISPDPKPEHLLLQEHIRTLIEWRGHRTHNVHLYAHLEEQPLAVVYRDTLIHSGKQPQIEFRDAELISRMGVLNLFLRWWVGSVEKQIIELVAN